MDINKSMYVLSMLALFLSVFTCESLHSFEFLTFSLDFRCVWFFFLNVCMLYILMRCIHEYTEKS